MLLVVSRDDDREQKMHVGDVQRLRQIGVRIAQIVEVHHERHKGVGEMIRLRAIGVESADAELHVEAADARRPGLEQHTLGAGKVVAARAGRRGPGREILGLLEVHAGELRTGQRREFDAQHRAALAIERVRIGREAAGRRRIIDARRVELDLVEQGLAAREEPGWKAVIEAGIRVLVDKEARLVGRDPLVQQRIGRVADGAGLQARFQFLHGQWNAMRPAIGRWAFVRGGSGREQMQPGKHERSPSVREQSAGDGSMAALGGGRTIIDDEVVGRKQVVGDDGSERSRGLWQFPSPALRGERGRGVEVLRRNQPVIALPVRWHRAAGRDRRTTRSRSRPHAGSRAAER